MKSIVAALALVPMSAVAADFGAAAFHFDGSRWNPAFQVCDMKDHVAATYYSGASMADYIAGDLDSSSLRYASFQKSNPAVGLKLSGAVDQGCGMGKCMVEFNNGDYNYMVVRSGYQNYDPASSPRVYGGQVTIRKNGDENPIFSQSCRRFERTRIACVTKNRTLYVSEDTNGGLEYRTFDFGNTSDTPSLLLKNGQEDHAMGGRVAYEFKNGAYGYRVETRSYLYAGSVPFAQVQVTKGGQVVATENCMSYTVSDVMAQPE